uniref:Uncharacterized protein n=1 Tax=Marseillevirus LCMAC101 TaxID=2506602 RepID=A0A481YUD7_9VIRU|nr:MAG: hypothetical protein LCMAC101_07110 [Marseillevirus LCMAC101]
MTQEDVNTDTVVDVPVTSEEKGQSEQRELRLGFCDRLGILGLALLALWFAILVISIVISICYIIYGVPTPRTVRGKVINQTSDFLDILSDGRPCYVEILTWPSDGMYPTTPVLGFWPFLDDYTVITTDTIKGKDIEVYRETYRETYKEDRYAVGKYCKGRTATGEKLSYFKCNEITTSLVYYLADGYMTQNFNIFLVLALLLIAVVLIVVAISCTVVPIWGCIGLCSMACCKDKRICSLWCLNMKKACDLDS